MDVRGNMAGAQNVDFAAPVRRAPNVHATHGIVAAEDNRASGVSLRVGDMPHQDAWNIC
jgi:hypothetical protein